MLNKKSLVLSDVNNSSNKKAVLTIQSDNNDVSGTLRLYNFENDTGLLTLGFYIDGKVIKSGLTKKSNMFYGFFLPEDILTKRFSCAVIEFKNGDAVPLLYGVSEGRGEDVYASIIDELSADFSSSKVQSVLDKYGVDYGEEEKKEIDEEIDRCMSKECENCYYKKYFYENSTKENVESEENTKDNQVEEVEEEVSESFVSRLKPQIDKLFENNPIEKNLEEIFPNSKFVKIEYEDDGDFYVFGLLYEGEKIKYVCYGIPAVYEEEPPKELSGYPIFVPLDKEKAGGFGYWLTYQDAETGEPIKASIE